MLHTDARFVPTVSSDCRVNSFEITTYRVQRDESNFQDNDVSVHCQLNKNYFVQIFSAVIVVYNCLL
jgi:hypothetical protein